VADVAEPGKPGVESVLDPGPGVLTELAEAEDLRAALGEEASSDVGDVGLEVAAEVGVVGDERRGSGESLCGVLPGEELGDEAAGLVEVGGGEAADGEVGQRVLAVDGGEQRVGGGPEVRGLRL